MPVGAGIAQAGIGLIQGIGGLFQAKKARKQLERLNSPTYAPNQGIANYYKTALNRFQTNPYASQGYTVAQQNAGRNLSAGLGALNDRRGGIAGISRLSAINNDTMLKAGTIAENQQNQRFGQLGGATQMKAADDKYAFQTNQLMPYQQKYNMLAGKAAGGNQIMNAGIQNVFGGLGSMGEASMFKSLYGNGKQQNQGLGQGYSGGNPYGSGGPNIF